MSEPGVVTIQSLPEPAVQSETAAIISMIERAARDPAVDIDKLERLFQMRERIEQRRAVQEYNAAMARAQEEMPAATRNRKNTHTGSTYADLYAIADAALPIIHKHGFGLSFSECKATEPNCMGISCRASHSGGHAEVYTFNVPVDAAGSQGKINKTQTQAYGSTFTYGRRYATCGVFNIIITDNDGNRQPTSSETISEAQYKELADLIKDTGTDLVKFLELGNVQSLSDIPAANFAKAKALLMAKKNKMVKP